MPSNKLREEIKAKILAQLAAGPKRPRVLRDSVGHYTKTSYMRAQAELRHSGQIKRAGLRPPSKTCRYQLVND